jgi:predicted DNA-binding transcriptional regulator AlpA
VLELIPVSKSTWWAGVKKGIFPKAIKLSTRITVWSGQDINDFGKIKSGKPNKLKPDRKTFFGVCFGGVHSLRNYRKAMFSYSYTICSIDALQY